MRRIFLPLLLPILSLCAACYQGDLGESCSAEHDCAWGLRCFTLPTTSLCAVRCADTCENGVCLQSSRGAICMAPCKNDRCTNPDLRCHASQSDPERKGCWTSDPLLDLIDPQGPVPEGPGRVEIAEVRIGEDENKDQRINPGEKVTLLFYLHNPGQEPITARYGEGRSSEFIQITRCSSGDNYLCSVADGQCTCAAHATQQRLDGGESAASPILRLRVTLAPNTPTGTLPFPLTIMTDAGPQERVADLTIETPDVDLQLVETRILADSSSDRNRDDRVNPGERIRLDVAIANRGTASALGLLPAFDLPPGLTPVQCHGWNYLCPTATEQSCACSSYGSAIHPGEEATVARVDFRVAQDLATGTYPIDLTLTDAFGQVHSVEVPVEVAHADGNLTVDEVRIVRNNIVVNALNPGDTARVHFFVGNSGTATVVDPWGQATVTSNLILNRCQTYTYSCTSETSQTCSCAQTSKQVIPPNEIATDSLISLDLRVDPASSPPYTIDLLFTDALGYTWAFTHPLEVNP